MEVSTTFDRSLLRRHFEKDRSLFAYHIGDLDPFFFEHCEWLVARNSEDQIDEAILIYHGPSQPTVLAFGLGARFDEFLESALPQLPDRFYCHYQTSSQDRFESAFKARPLGEHLKMTLGTLPPEYCAITDRQIIRLQSSHLPSLLRLYDEAYPDSYFDERMVQTGKCFGWMEGERLVATAGIHVYSREYRVAALGNITTHPDSRGRGLATRLTARLSSELLTEGLTVTLNVAADNGAAIHCYRKLGFQITHPFREAEFIRPD